MSAILFMVAKATLHAAKLQDLVSSPTVTLTAVWNSPLRPARQAAKLQGLVSSPTVTLTAVWNSPLRPARQAAKLQGLVSSTTVTLNAVWNSPLRPARQADGVAMQLTKPVGEEASGVPKHGLDAREEIEDAVVVDNAEDPPHARSWKSLHASALALHAGTTMMLPS